VFMTENVQAALLALPMELQRIGAELSTGLAEFHNGQRVDAARYVDVRRAPLLWGDRCRLVGWSLRPAGVEPASVTLRNGRDDSAEVVAVIELGDTAQTAWLGGGIAVGEALWADVDGTVEGAVYLGVVD
jgi:hypothetical protein